LEKGGSVAEEWKRGGGGLIKMKERGKPEGVSRKRSDIWKGEQEKGHEGHNQRKGGGRSGGWMKIREK
jgi:hypothetical protein